MLTVYLPDMFWQLMCIKAQQNNVLYTAMLYGDQRELSVKHRTNNKVNKAWVHFINELKKYDEWE